jgi:hypothetical protein
MIGTFNCNYETPCGWCTKWDKKCDKKIGGQKPNNKPERKLDAYDIALSPCKNCKYIDNIRNDDKSYCEPCWAHGFEYFTPKESE